MKKKFKILAFILAIICVTTMAYGCGKNATQNTTNTASTTITVSAAESQQSNLGFQLVYEQRINGYNVIFFWREISTDTMYIETVRSTRDGYGSGLIQMPDPETGLPLTYTKWLNSYQ